MFPNLQPHQQVILVPGIFACSNLTFYPLEKQSVQVVDKLSAFFEWVRCYPASQPLSNSRRDALHSRRTR